ncbi:unnamed protein product [Calypogeia fissa]
MSTSECGGYHWSQGQYVLSSCNPESSTFFIVLGFTMLVLVLLFFIIIVIACVRKQRLRRARPSPPLASQENEDDCVIDLTGIGQTGDGVNGRNLDNVKAVIMAGENKATFIAHPIPPISPSSSDLTDDEEQEVHLDELSSSRASTSTSSSLSSSTPSSSRPCEQWTHGVDQEGS